MPERIELFAQGLERLGYEVMPGMTDQPAPGDALLTWNRISTGDHLARSFEARGCKVLVAENATWGNSFAGEDWYSLGLNYHNTAGLFPVGGPERWDALGVELQPFREGGSTILLPQRGIGPKPVAMPPGWTDEAFRRFGGRVRPHPGRGPSKPLEEDLEGVGLAVTWGSGAAVKALMMGVKVWSEMPNWIAAQDNSNEGRLTMFRRLAWGQWRLDEIRDGSALSRYLV